MSSSLKSNIIITSKKVTKHFIPKDVKLYSLLLKSMVMAKKIVFEIIADSDSTTLKT